MGRFSVTVLATMLLLLVFGCENDSTDAETIKELTCDVTSTNVTTNGGSDGTITVNVLTGNNNYVYTLNGTNINYNGRFTNLTAGTYQLKVIDSKNKEYNKSVTITQPNQLTVTITSQTNVTCYGRSTGSFTVTASGESGNYEYKIGNGTYQNNGTFSNLSAGTYTVTVKSGTVTTTKDITITQPNQLSLTSSVTNPTTVGGNGQITLTTSGGTLPYNYQLNSGTFQSSNVFNATAGTYTATVKDGCNDTKTINNIVVTNPVIAPTVSNLSESNITSTSVTLNGKVNANGYTTSSLYFEYGTTTSYGTTVSLTNLSGNTLTNVSTNISGLTPNTVYHYRLVAINDGGTTFSDDKTFKTLELGYNVGDQLYGGTIFKVDGVYPNQTGLIAKNNDVYDYYNDWLNAKNYKITDENNKTWRTPNETELLLLFTLNSTLNSPYVKLKTGNAYGISYWTSSGDNGKGIAIIMQSQIEIKYYDVYLKLSGLRLITTF